MKKKYISQIKLNRAKKTIRQEGLFGVETKKGRDESGETKLYKKGIESGLDPKKDYDKLVQFIYEGLGGGYK